MDSQIETALASGLRVLRAVAPAITRQLDHDHILEQAIKAEQRGYFTPEEDERLRHNFAQYLVAREALHECIQELKPFAYENNINRELQLQAFLLAYTAACLLVNAAQFVVGEANRNEVLMSKLNEEEGRYGIDPKEATRIYSSLTSPTHALSLNKAYDFACDNYEEIKNLAASNNMQDIFSLMQQVEGNMDRSLFDFIKDRVDFRMHSFNRRNRSGAQKAMFALFEFSGRLFSELVNTFREKDVTAQARQEAEKLLQPGDVLVTRHKQAATNLFLPGFWPHAALYIGHDKQREGLKVNLSEDLKNRWRGNINVLEARKDGVLFRELEDTLNVDYFTILRPHLTAEQLALVLARAASHEGKLYDFNFDFSRSDRMVCTEVVYRSYQGIADVEFELSLRAGRYTFSAEDLLHKALNKEGFDVLANFGLKEESQHVVVGTEARDLLIKSMA